MPRTVSRTGSRRSKLWRWVDLDLGLRVKSLTAFGRRRHRRRRALLVAARDALQYAENTDHAVTLAGRFLGSDPADRRWARATLRRLQESAP